MVFKRGIVNRSKFGLTVFCRVLDLVIVILSLFAAFYLRFDFNAVISQTYENFFIGSLFFALIAFELSKLYVPLRDKSYWFLFSRIVISWALVLIFFTSLAFFTKTSELYSRVFVALWFILAFLLHISVRMLLFFSLHILRSRGFNQKKVLIIGLSGLTEQVKKQICSHPSLGYEIASIINIDNFCANQQDLSLSCCEMIQSATVDKVWITLPLKEDKYIKAVIHELRFSTASISLVPNLGELDLINHSVTEVSGIPFINLSATPMVGFSYFIKRCEDICLSLIILLMLSPVMFFIAMMIKITSRGPVFYKQVRMTSGCKSFNMLKFRSMPVTVEAETGPVWAKSTDQRATKIGGFLRKYSLDELPQFLNVLKGDMSIVGPRPERPVFIEDFKHKIPRYMKKHMMKAGITGLAQISGFRGNTDLSIRVEKDLEYIDNWTLWLDLKIIFITCFKVFSDKNAY